MHRPGEAYHRRELHQHRHRCLDHLGTDEGMSLGRLDTDKRLSFYHQLTKLGSGAQQSCVVTKQQQSARVRVNHNSERIAALPGWVCVHYDIVWMMTWSR